MNQKRLQFLKDLKQRSLAENVPNVTENNARFLHFLLQTKKAKNVLEIGTANGYSGIWLADAVEPWGGHVTSIDGSAQTHNEAIKNTKAAGTQNITLILGLGQDEMPKLPKKHFDVVFIDAHKKHYPVFWELTKPLLKDDGIVIVDDVLAFPEKTQNFHEHMKTETQYDQVIIPIDENDGVMLVKRKLT